MSDTADKWRARAAELRRMAEDIKDSKAKSDVIKLAIDWEIMAERQASHEQRDRA